MERIVRVALNRAGDAPASLLLRLLPVPREDDTNDSSHPLDFNCIKVVAVTSSGLAFAGAIDRDSKPMGFDARGQYVRIVWEMLCKLNDGVVDLNWSVVMLPSTHAVLAVMRKGMVMCSQRLESVVYGDVAWGVIESLYSTREATGAALEALKLEHAQMEQQADELRAHALVATRAREKVERELMAKVHKLLSTKKALIAELATQLKKTEAVHEKQVADLTEQLKRAELEGRRIAAASVAQSMRDGIPAASASSPSTVASSSRRGVSSLEPASSGMKRGRDTRSDDDTDLEDEEEEEELVGGDDDDAAAGTDEERAGNQSLAQARAHAVYTKSALQGRLRTQASLAALNVHTQVDEEEGDDDDVGLAAYVARTSKGGSKRSASAAVAAAPAPAAVKPKAAGGKAVAAAAATSKKGTTKAAAARRVDDDDDDDFEY